MARIKTWAWWLTHPRVNLDHILSELRYRLITLPVAAYERAKFGWSKWDIHAGWDGSVMRAIGEQLVYFSKNTIASPDEDYDGWVNTLRTNGEAILAYCNQDSRMPKVLMDYYNNNFSFSAPKPPEIVEALAEYRADEIRRYEEAKKAMHWLAENFGSLWD